MSGGRRRPNTKLAYALTIPALVGCVVFAITSSHRGLSLPLTWALAAFAVCASTAYVPLEGKLLVDATFVPLLLAIAFLGPAPAFVIVVASELGAWAIQRYRLVVVPINLVAVGGIAMLGAAWFDALDIRDGPGFLAVLAATGAVTLVINDIVITALVGVLDGSPIRERLAGHRKLVPSLAINVALGVAVASLYSHTGVEVLVFVCGLIVGFNYMVRQTLRALQHARRSDELAASRQALLRQALDAESRERRLLAESLHDGALQILYSAGQDLTEAGSGDRGALMRASEAVEATRREIRATVYELHPAVVEQAGLGKTLEEMVRRVATRAGLVYEVEVDEAADGISDQLLISIARELVGNVVQHSGARAVRVLVSRDRDGVALQVLDDGCGFDDEARKAAVAAGHIGLAACIERCAARNGRIEFESRPGLGATIRAWIPVACADAATSSPEVDLSNPSYRASANTSSAALGGPQGPMRAQ